MVKYPVSEGFPYIYVVNGLTVSYLSFHGHHLDFSAVGIFKFQLEVDTCLLVCWFQLSLLYVIVKEICIGQVGDYLSYYHAIHYYLLGMN